MTDPAARTPKDTSAATPKPDDADEEADPVREGLDPDRASAQSRLEARFPQEDPGVIADALEDAAEDLVDARITMFRPLLVQHNASDALAHSTAADPSPPGGDA